MDVSGSEIGIIGLAGQLNVVSSPGLRKVIDDHLDAGQTRLIVDLSQVDDVDSSGLAALVYGLRVARRRNGDIRIVQPRDRQAMRIFELTTFDQIFTIGKSADALAQGWNHQETTPGELEGATPGELEGATPGELEGATP